MYTSYYKLTAKPFSEKAAPETTWLQEKTEKALAIFKKNITENKGISLLTGEVGTGKTTFVNRLISSFPDNLLVGNVVNFGPDPLEFLQLVAECFHLETNFLNQDEFFSFFQKFLHASLLTHKRVVLLIDEAQQLNNDLLAIVHRLAKLEENGTRLLHLFLLGQNDFNTMLFQPDNNELRQQISTSFILAPLNKAETEEYIHYHLRLVNGSKNIFSPEAIQEIHTFSKGLPRLINLLCDLALLAGSAEEKDIISKKLVKNCIKNLLLPNEDPQEFPLLVEQKAREFWQHAIKTKPRMSGWLKPSYGILVLLILVLFGVNLLLDQLRETNNGDIQDKPPIIIEKETTETQAVQQDQVKSLIAEIQKKEVMKEEKQVTKEEPANKPEIFDNPLIPKEQLALITDRPPVNLKLQEDTKVPGPWEEIKTEEAAQPSRKEDLSPEKHPFSLIIEQILSKTQEDLPSPPDSLRETVIATDLRILSTKEVKVSFGNLRAQPSTQSNVITIVNQGDMVSELQKKNDWYFVKLNDGRLGWMHQTLFIAPTVEVEQETLAATPKTAEEKVIDTAEKPSEISTDKKDSQVEVLPLKLTITTPEQTSVPPPPTEEPAPEFIAAVRQEAEKQPAPSPAAQQDNSPKQTLPTVQKHEAAPQANTATRAPVIPATPVEKENTTQQAPTPTVNKTLIRTNNPEALEWVRKSYLSVSRLDYAAAIAEATKAIALDPGRPEPYINRAWAYTETGAYEKATEDCTVALRIDPDSALAYNNKGLAYHRMGNLRLANDNYQQACDRKLQVACNNLEQVSAKLSILPLLEKGQDLLDQQKWDAARQVSSEILKLQPENQEAILLRAVADQKEKDQQLALEWTQRSYASVSQGRYAEAIEEATKAIALDAGQINPYINRAWAYSETGSSAQAIIDCNTALSLDPGNALALNNLGLAYQNMGETAMALEYYGKACEQKLTVGCENVERMTNLQ